MIGVLVFIGVIILFMTCFLFLMMSAIKTERQYMSHLKSEYPAVYDDNPLALGGAADHTVIRKHPGWSVVFTKAKSLEAKQEYNMAKKDAVVQKLKGRSWMIWIAGLIIIPTSFGLLLFLLFFTSN